MSDRELRINVYNSSKIGHTNVSFYEDDEHVFTIGANVRSYSPGLITSAWSPDGAGDGVYLDETAYHAQAMETGTVVSAAVPVTEEQYDDLLAEARALEGETFDYGLFTDACIELVEEFYAATEHPGQFGDLFAEPVRAGSLVWERVPITPASLIINRPETVPYYSPGPLLPVDVPVPPAPSVPSRDNLPVIAVDEAITTPEDGDGHDPATGIPELAETATDWSDEDERILQEALNGEFMEALRDPEVVLSFGTDEALYDVDFWPTDDLSFGLYPDPPRDSDPGFREVGIPSPFVRDEFVPVSSRPTRDGDDAPAAGSSNGRSDGDGRGEATAAYNPDHETSGDERRNGIDYASDQFEFAEAAASETLSFGDAYDDGLHLDDTLRLGEEELSFGDEQPASYDDLAYSMGTTIEEFDL